MAADKKGAGSFESVGNGALRRLNFGAAAGVPVWSAKFGEFCPFDPSMNSGQACLMSVAVGNIRAGLIDGWTKLCELAVFAACRVADRLGIGSENVEAIRCVLLRTELVRSVEWGITAETISRKGANAGALGQGMQRGKGVLRGSTSSPQADALRQALDRQGGLWVDRLRVFKQKWWPNF